MSESGSTTSTRRRLPAPSTFSWRCTTSSSLSCRRPTLPVPVMSTGPTSRAGSPQFSAKIGPCASTASTLRRVRACLLSPRRSGPKQVHPCECVGAHCRGAVDVESSAAAAVDRAIDILGSTDRDPETLRVRGELDGFGDWSLQYGADIVAGHILVGAGNTVVDFAGMASTAALGRGKPSAPRRAAECATA